MPSPRPANPALPDYHAALARVLDAAAEPTEVEEIELRAAAGRVLAEVVRADRDYPPFNRATMDGYALRASELSSTEAFEVVGMVAAGSGVRPAVGPRQAVRIATGAPVPDAVDAVIPHEQSDRAEPVRFTIGSIEPGANIHPRGVDARAGQPLIEPGVVLGAQHMGILATVGCAAVRVRPRPRVAVLTSGDEVLPPNAPRVLQHQIRNAGSSMLPMMIDAMGGAAGQVAHVADEPAATAAAVQAALAEHDVLVTIGGISAGERDCFHAAFEAAGVEAVLRGAAIQPGKPVFVGRVLRGDRAGFVVALPGNPVSVLATAHLFLWPLLRRLCGCSASLPWTEVALAREVSPNARRQAFRPSSWARGSNCVEVLDWAGSGDLIHTSRADGLAALPVQSEPISAGDTLSFLPWCWTR